MRVNPDYGRLNVESQRANHRSLLNFYRQLIALRRESPALMRGTYRSPLRPIDVWAYERAAEGQRMLVVLNFFSRPAEFQLIGSWRVRLSSEARPDSAVAGTLTLGPNEAVILEA